LEKKNNNDEGGKREMGELETKGEKKNIKTASERGQTVYVNRMHSREKDFRKGLGSKKKKD